jgi:hypothetical protein
MAEIPIDVSGPGSENLTYMPSDGVPIHFSDAFLVGATPEMFMLNFYQQEIGEVRGNIKHQTFEQVQATCFARIAVTPVGYLRLLHNMAERVGLVLANKPDTTRQEEPA